MDVKVQGQNQEGATATARGCGKLCSQLCEVPKKEKGQKYHSLTSKVFVYYFHVIHMLLINCN